MSDKELKTASVLAFERKIDPSDALFSAGQWNHRNHENFWPAIRVHEKSVRGTISNRLKSKDQDPAKLDSSLENPNLQKVDCATLPSDADTLCVRFTLRVLGGAGVPSACNKANYQEKLRFTVEQYVRDIGFSELAHRYATNIANGRFLWRNRIGAEQVEVYVNQLSQGKVSRSWHFNALDFSLRDFTKKTPEISELSNCISAGLAGTHHTLLEIITYVRIGQGQEVYPSQELILDKGDKKGQKSKTLYQVNHTAGLHSQKIGNALRTIDTWYPVNSENTEVMPIPIEPYGSVTAQGKAYRQPKEKADFYNLLDNWIIKDKTPSIENQHFVMATFIRGGVFGEKD